MAAFQRSEPWGHTEGDVTELMRSARSESRHTAFQNVNCTLRLSHGYTASARLDRHTTSPRICAPRNGVVPGLAMPRPLSCLNWEYHTLLRPFPEPLRGAPYCAPMLPWLLLREIRVCVCVVAALMFVSNHAKVINSKAKVHHGHSIAQAPSIDSGLTHVS